MEQLQKSIEQLAATMTSQMNEFQREIRQNIPAASPTSNINAQFNTFRSFVLTALENLQLQLQMLARQQDDMEVRTRRSMLLVHGVQEARGEDPAESVCKAIRDRLEMPDISVEDVKRCHRMGRTPTAGKPRVIIVKFKDLNLRNKVWFSKAKFKGSGITLSEFLTKGRHEAFVAARKRFGVSRSWTRDGCVVVLGADGTHHRVVSVAEVDAIPEPAGGASGTAGPSVAATQAPSVVHAAAMKLVHAPVTPKPNIHLRARKPNKK